MNITRLTARNFKGQTFEHELAPVTLFHGKNFAGKSARVEALVLALAGYIPGASKKPNELFEQFASSDLMSVTASFTGVLEYFRKWSSTGGKVSVEETDGLNSCEPVAIDATEYLGMSADKRIKFLFGRAKLPEKYNVRNVSKTIVTNIKNVKCDPHTEQHESVCSDLIEFVSGHSGDDIQALIEALVEGIRQKRLLAEANLKRMRQTVQGLAQSTVAKIVPPDAEQAYNRTKTIHHTIVEKHAQLTVGLTAATKAEQEAEWAKDKLATVADKQKLLETAIKEAEHYAKHKVDEPAPALRTAWDKARQAVERAQTTITGLKTRLAMVQRQIQGMGKDKVCPHCGQDMEEVSKKVLAKLRKEAKEFEEEVDDNTHALALAEKAEESARQTMESAQQKFSAWKDRYHTALEDKAELEKQLAGTETWKEKAAKLPSAKKAVQKLQGEVAGMEGELQKAMSDVKDAETSYKALLGQRAEAANKAKVLSEAQRAEAEADVLKQVQKMMGELQKELVEQAVGPFLEKANELCGGILKAPLEYRDGDIGMTSNGKFYSHKSFSGTEKAISYCAVSVALATEAPLRLCILDELGRLDAGNKLKLVRLLCDLQTNGKIDQAVLVDTQPLLSVSRITSDNYKEIGL
jgi:DNA repair exonuclease SbcCD ATPase subunit